MSRSYYKTLTWKLKNVKFYKRLCHKRNRHKKNIPNGSYYKRSVDSWDICDYKWYVTSTDVAKALKTWLTLEEFYKMWSK